MMIWENNGDDDRSDKYDETTEGKGSHVTFGLKISIHVYRKNEEGFLLTSA